MSAVQPTTLHRTGFFGWDNAAWLKIHRIQWRGSAPSTGWSWSQARTGNSKETSELPCLLPSIFVWCFGIYWLKLRGSNLAARASCHAVLFWLYQNSWNKPKNSYKTFVFVTQPPWTQPSWKLRMSLGWQSCCSPGWKGNIVLGTSCAWFSSHFTSTSYLCSPVDPPLNDSSLEKEDNSTGLLRGQDRTPKVWISLSGHHDLLPLI